MTKQVTPRRIRRCASSGTDQRGSAIVLVLVSILLLAILAGSLLQLTRFQRIPQAGSNIEIVVQSVIAEVLNQATEDLLDENGDYLNVINTANGGGDEPWDFPWTNANITTVRRSIEDHDGATYPIAGGVMDDTWLADHMPDFRPAIPANSIYNDANFGPIAPNTTNGVWRKITSLTGLYLGGNGTGNADLTLTTGDYPNEFPVDFTNMVRRDMNIPVNNNMLVDADGDGIGDSRWEWAPLRQIGNTQYVMAVRIVDLSARMDLNVAMGSTGSSGSPALSTIGPRGDGPTELDGAAFVSYVGIDDTNIGLANAQADWRRALELRLTGNTGVTTYNTRSYDGNTVNPADSSRRGYWTQGASRVSNEFERNGETPGGFDYSAAATFNSDDMLELLYRNGVNSSSAQNIEAVMPELTRTANTESSTAVADATNVNTVNSWSDRDFWELDFRKHVSTVTGSAITARPYNTSQTRDLKFDVNEATADQLRAEILDFMNLTPNAASLRNLYPHLSSNIAFAEQLAANIKDYIDEDNSLTLVGNHYGFEALPYITEVYTQRLYEATVTLKNPVDPALNEADWTQAGDQGYAIEIANPFARYNGSGWDGRPIRLDDIWLSFDGGTTTHMLSTLAGQPELEPGDVLYLYRNSSGNTSNPTDDDLSSYYSTTTASSNFNVIPVVGPALPVGATGVTISLHARVGTAAETWAYNACEIELGGDNLPTEDVDSADFVDSQTYQTYVQTNYQGVGEGLRMMTVVAAPQSGGNTRGFGDTTTTRTSPSDNADTASGEANRPTLGALGDENKPNAPTGFGNLDNQQIVWHDNPRGRMHWVGDILQIPLIGAKNPAAADETMAEAFYLAANNSTTLSNATTGTGVNTLLLPYKAVGVPGMPVVDGNTATTAGGGFGVLNIPHSMMLLERLTTFNPATDGEDGDGNTANENPSESFTNPDLDEVLVPGKLNLNTAPYDTLVRLLPFPDEPTRERIAQAIVDRRENMAQESVYSIGADDVPGIAYVSSLYEQLQDATATPGNLSNDGNDTGALNSVQIDLNENEDPMGTFTTADGIADDREEEIMLAKWLNEMTDNRSDVFAAYIVVQGYPAGDFSQGPNESAQLVIYFTRAGVAGSDDRAVMIKRRDID
ncbi:MAG: hypothetical protein KTR15_02690 [Phycisphaeraceae bacterium]|nr:hypothetical protein [Phycisphaeraceae bacterium]